MLKKPASSKHILSYSEIESRFKSEWVLIENTRLTKSLEPLAPHRSDMTIFGGLSHPTSRLLVGHNTGDVWLTGADIRVDLQNSISIDQLTHDDN